MRFEKVRVLGGKVKNRFAFASIARWFRSEAADHHYYGSFYV